MTTTTTVARATPRGAAVRYAAVAASSVAGVLLGVGGTLLVVDDDPRPAATAPASDASLDGLFEQEGLRIAVQRCVAAPPTPDAAATCRAALRAAGEPHAR